MLTAVTVQSETRPNLVLRVKNARTTDSLLLDKIEGLEPTGLENFIGDYARDGGVYQGRRSTRRAVNMFLTLNPNPQLNETFSSLRQKVYKYFGQPGPTRDDISFLLDFDTDSSMRFFGYVEKMEPNIFSPDTDMPISLILTQAYLEAAQESVVTANGPAVPVAYPGSVKCGYVIEFEIVSNVTSLYIASDNYSNPFRLNYTFATGDKITVDTRKGSRGVRLTRNGLTIPLTFARQNPSPWPSLYDENTVVRVYGVNGSSSNPYPIVAAIKKITYRSLYWGI